MNLSKICKRAATTFFIAIIACLLFSTGYMRPLEIGLFTFISGLLSIIVYALGDIVESLRYICTAITEQKQDLKNDSTEDPLNDKPEKPADDYDFEKVPFKP